MFDNLTTVHGISITKEDIEGALNSTVDEYTSSKVAENAETTNSHMILFIMRLDVGLHKV